MYIVGDTFLPQRHDEAGAGGEHEALHRELERLRQLMAYREGIVVVTGPTGSGKSLCYWIAGKGRGGVTLVIFPLTALMDEQAQKLAGHGCKVFTLHSGIDSRKQYQILNKII